MVKTGRQLSLSAWKARLYPVLRKIRSFEKAPFSNVTLLAYFYWDDDRIDTTFHEIECAFLCAWKSWGMLPSVLVVNRTTQRIRDFCALHGVDIQVDAMLTGGIRPMCIDCISRLHRRFDTEYVVIVQTDGMPVNSGLERFLGKYDYVGAPWSGHTFRKDWFPYPKYGVGNGGFSLRSKRICEQAAKAFNTFWTHLPYSWLLGDDVFYCKTMPFLSGYWRNNFRYASREEALQFSIEHLPPDMTITMPPLGFHSAVGFDNYVKHFGVPFAELVDGSNNCGR